MNYETRRNAAAAEAMRAAATARRIVERAARRFPAFSDEVGQGFDLQETPRLAPEYAATNARMSARKAAHFVMIGKAREQWGRGSKFYAAARAAAYAEKYARMAAEHACAGAALV